MAMSSKRVPSLTASANYAQFGSWKTDLKAYLSYNDMQLWSSLDESKMPDAFPAAVAEDATGYDEYVAQTTRFKSRYDIDDEWSFLASSEKAWGTLHNATRSAPDLNRIVSLHESDFKGAYLALEKHVRGNIKTAARSMRSELYAKIRSTTSASQVLTLITVIQRGNQDLAQLGTGDEISDTDLYEETLDILQRIPDLKHVYQLARLSSSNIGDWTSLKPKGAR